MRYISDDGKVFNTEQECLEHENSVNEERIKTEKLKKEQNNRYNKIKEHYEELMKEISSYEKDYNTRVFRGFYTNGLSHLITELLKS